MNNGFLYFLPGTRMNSAGRDGLKSILESTGLDAILPNGSITQNEVQGGPCGKGAGLMFSCTAKGAGDPIYPKYESEKQTWVDAGTHCVGMYTDNPPTPSELARPKMVMGYYWVDDRDEQWTIPLVRVADGETMLPNVAGRGPDGAMIKKPKARYKRLCEFASAHFDLLTGLLERGEVSYTQDWEMHFSVACEALGINYHVGPYEITLLESMDENGISDICGKLCDIHGLASMIYARAEAEKKSDSAHIPAG